MDDIQLSKLRLKQNFYSKQTHFCVFKLLKKMLQHICLRFHNELIKTFFWDVSVLKTDNIQLRYEKYIFYDLLQIGQIFSIRFRGLVVMTPTFESGGPGSIPGQVYFWGFFLNSFFYSYLCFFQLFQTFFIEFDMY